MILFEEDWQLWPTAIADTETKNRSFVHLAAKYRSMGVSNHTFLLALVNPALQGVDPHDPNLTLEQMAMVAVECKQNPWFFFREVARAPGESGSEAVPLEANRGNIALFWSFFNHILIILIQIRQTGKSFSTDVLMNLLLNILCTDTKINLLTKDDNLRRKNIQRLKDIRDELPRYLQQQTGADASNTEEITVKSLGNVYNTHVPQSSRKRAYNMGRGLTSAIFHIDEPPFQPNIDVALPAALAATGAAVDRAKEVGAPYGTILTTTAGKRDDKDGAYIYNLLSESAVWTERFLDARNWTELEKLVRRSSRAGKLQINATFNHLQLGKTDAWLRTKLEDSLQTGDDANRDYFNMWTSGSATNPIATHILEKISKSHREDLYTSISNPHGYLTRWYIPEEDIDQRLRTGKFVMGMDTSEASGGDDISLVLVDVENLETIAVGTYNETNLITFAEWVCQWLVNYDSITAIIERRSTGAFLLDYLLRFLPERGIDPFKRLFNLVVNNYEEEPERFTEIKTPMGRRPQDIYVRFKKTFGYATSGSGQTSRNALYGLALQNAAKRAADRVYDKSLIDQITGLINKNGRIDHADGEHDDLVIGWLLVHWLLSIGTNLSYYGIDTRRVMTNIATKSAETDEARWQREEQETIRNQMEAIYEELTGETDEFLSMRLEQELRRLDRMVVLEAGEIYSVDSLIKKAAESRRNRRIGNKVNQYDNYKEPTNHHGRVYVYDRPLTAADLRA